MAPFAQRALDEHGVRSSVSLPMAVDNSAVAVLNVNSRTPEAYSDSVLQLGELFAAQVALVLTVTQRLHGHLALTQQLQTALTSRGDRPGDRHPS